MFDYKDASFYTSYFSEHPLFKLTEEFKETEDEEDKNLYVGYVEVLDTIHPLILRVEIPKSFPHQHLVFRTKSLSGYPHLIHNGKIKYGDWFCLNTPFAETPEEQLNQEISRLSEWINHQMRPDLPAVIKDEKVIQGLRFANAYDWENFDEMNEFSSKATLTFIGDFHKDPNSFKSKKGHLNCIKTPDNRFYAFPHDEFAKYKLPYIIVDEEPKTVETYRNFVSLKEQYGWGEDICEHLLPSFSLHQIWTRNTTQHVGSKCSLRTALKKIETIKQELAKDDCYLPASDGISRSKTKVLTKLLRQPKEIILKELEPEMEKVGFTLSQLGGNDWSINAIPAGMGTFDVKDTLLQVIESITTGGESISETVYSKIALTVAKNSAIPYGKTLNDDEMEDLLVKLLQLPNPNYTPDGKTVISVISNEQIEKLF